MSTQCRIWGGTSLKGLATVLAVIAAFGAIDRPNRPTTLQVVAERAELAVEKPPPAEEELMQEIEYLRTAHGVRWDAAVALVAERHDLDVAELKDAHFAWLMCCAGFAPTPK